MVPAEETGSRAEDETHACLAPSLGREDLQRASVASDGLDANAVGTIAIPGPRGEPAGKQVTEPSALLTQCLTALLMCGVERRYGHREASIWPAKALAKSEPGDDEFRRHSKPTAPRPESQRMPSREPPQASDGRRVLHCCWR